MQKISKIDKIYKARDSRNSVKKVVVVVQLRSTLQLHGMHMLGFLSFTVSPSLLKLTSIESMVPSNHLILCCPLLFLPSIFPSIRVLSNELLASGGQFWDFTFSISPSTLVNHLGYLGHYDLFCVVLLCILASSF